MSTDLTKRKLPTLQELYEDDINKAFKQDQFNLILNQQPKQEWVKQNRYANNSNYIPIGIIETLLQKIFKSYRVEVLREGQMFNAVYCTIRLHYYSYVTNEWEFHDGVGAVQLQTKEGASPADLQNINNNAVMMALPMAKSYAIKDAVEHLGKLFGRDLNRKDENTMAFTTNLTKNINEVKEHQRIKDFIDAAKSLEEIKQIEAVIPTDLVDHYNHKILSLK
jgi:hypothetical protein